MKKSLQCPKCESKKLWHIERLPERGSRGTQQMVEHQALSLAHSVWRGFQAQGAIEMFACARCGFAELYADTSDLMESEDGGVRLIDNEPAEGLR
jgi:predicted nucleic-acid-binding Zn-ribbon protein